MSYTDKTLTCVECGASFTFSAEDQEYHASRGFTNEPKRCSACREARKSERGGGGGLATVAATAPLNARCTPPFAPSAAPTLRFRSSRGVTGRSIAASAIPSAHRLAAATRLSLSILARAS